jgi:ferrochelatase
MLPDVLPEIAAAGHRSILALFTSPYSSYSSCRQYWGDIAAAREASGLGPVPRVDKLPAYFDHPLFIEAWTDRVTQALKSLPGAEGDGRGVDEPWLIFTAHSIPAAMAAGCPYESQLLEVSALVAEATGVRQWELAYQSRSGSAHMPWLGPDIVERLGELGERGERRVVVAPIGFLTDHIEVLYDLDVEAAGVARALGLGFERAQTANDHPAFIAMLTDLVQRGRAAPAPVSP